MPDKHDENETESVSPSAEDYTTETLMESDEGRIIINNNVIANIVKIATLEIPEVVSIKEAGGLSEFAGLFSRKDNSRRGITVESDENDNYRIAVVVVLSFGVELAKVGSQIREVIREKVEKMTNNKVIKVDVIIDEVKMPDNVKVEDDYPDEEDQN